MVEDGTQGFIQQPIRSIYQTNKSWIINSIPQKNCGISVNYVWVMDNGIHTAINQKRI